MPRATADAVVLVVAITVAVILCGFALGTIIVEVSEPGTVPRTVWESFAGVLGVLIGAVVGYLLGARRFRNVQ